MNFSNLLNYDVDIGRWNSYYKQIEEIINCNAKSVLLIGVGDGLVPYIVNRINPLIRVETYDLESSLKPDICGDIRELLSNVGGRKWEAIVCCQVLEHLPYAEFEGILSQISQCLENNGKAIISLPDRGVRIQFSFRISKYHIDFFHKVPRIWRTEYKYDGMHYWEIDSARPYHRKKIRAVLRKEFRIDKDYLVPNNTWHHFFVLSKLS